MSDDEEYLDINDLTEKQWADIRAIAIQLYNSKQFGGSQLKCSVHAFLLWMEKNGSQLAWGQIDEEPPTPSKH